MLNVDNRDKNMNRYRLFKPEGSYFGGRTFFYPLNAPISYSLCLNRKFWISPALTLRDNNAYNNTN